MLGLVVTPSHASSASQFVAFPTDVLMVFPVQGEHESPFLKYPALQTKSEEKIRNIIMYALKNRSAKEEKPVSVNLTPTRSLTFACHPITPSISCHIISIGQFKV